jgi:hypothetical protein
MTVTSSSVRTFRWAVFLITLGYFIYRFFDTDPDQFGAQFRLLTVWGLTASTLSAWFMLQYSMGWSTRQYQIFASVTVVLNATVVLMYWKIYFQDPSLFYGADGQPRAWHQEYFLHAVGPALQIFDAFFILGAFRVFRGLIGYIMAVPVAYIVWIELLVRPMNDTPVGSVTTGLPYLFMNDMDVSERATFYGTTVATMFILFLISWTIAWALRKVVRRPSDAPRSL